MRTIKIYFTLVCCISFFIFSGCISSPDQFRITLEEDNIPIDIAVKKLNSIYKKNKYPYEINLVGTEAWTNLYFDIQKDIDPFVNIDAYAKVKKLVIPTVSIHALNASNKEVLESIEKQNSNLKLIISESSALLILMPPKKHLVNDDENP